jgi:hypothetical protein
MGRITSTELRQIMDYDPSTGVFTWKRPDVFHPRLKGKQAGCLKAGYRQIEIKGVVYRASHLAWLYIHRYFPENGIAHVGDPADDRIRNLRLRWEA